MAKRAEGYKYLTEQDVMFYSEMHKDAYGVRAMPPAEMTRNAYRASCDLFGQVIDDNNETDEEHRQREAREEAERVEVYENAPAVFSPFDALDEMVFAEEGY